MTWSPEMENTLVEMVNQGATQSQILAIINPKFGKSYTRSAIGGKMNRMGLKSKSGLKGAAGYWRNKAGQIKGGQVKGGQVKTRKPRRPQLKCPPRKRAIKSVQPANFGRGVSLENLRDSQCRFPINSVDSAKDCLRFCGQLADKTARTAQERSYCSGHAAIITARPGDGQYAYLKSLDKTTKYLT